MIRNLKNYIYKKNIFIALIEKDENLILILNC